MQDSIKGYYLLSQALWNFIFAISPLKVWRVQIKSLFLQCSFWMLKAHWDRWPTVSNVSLGNHRRAGHIHTKAFSERFGFDALRISQIQTICQKQSNGNAPWGVVIVSIAMMDYDIYIGVGLSALLGQTDRAMREPSKRGPSTELAPRFFVCMLK